MSVSEEDKKFYEELVGRELSDAEVQEADDNLVGAFSLLYIIRERTNGK